MKKIDFILSKCKSLWYKTGSDYRSRTEWFSSGDDVFTIKTAKGYLLWNLDVDIIINQVLIPNKIRYIWDWWLYIKWHNLHI